MLFFYIKLFWFKKMTKRFVFFSLPSGHYFEQHGKRKKQSTSGTTCSPHHPSFGRSICGRTLRSADSLFKMVPIMQAI